MPACFQWLAINKPIYTFNSCKSHVLFPHWTARLAFQIYISCIHLGNDSCKPFTQSGLQYLIGKHHAELIETMIVAKWQTIQCHFFVKMQRLKALDMMSKVLENNILDYVSINLYPQSRDLVRVKFRAQTFNLSHFHKSSSYCATRSIARWGRHTAYPYLN